MKDKLIIIALCSVAFSLWSDAINSTSLAEIYAQFPDASTFLQGFIVTGPYLLSIPFVLIIGKLARKISKKTLLLIVLMIYTISGVVGAFADSMTIFAVVRSVSGIATCTIGMLLFSIIFEQFPDEDNSAKVMGIFHAFSSAYGSAIAIIAGMLSAHSWRFAQYLNGIGFISIIMVLIFLPKTQPEGLKEMLINAEGVLDKEIKTDIKKIVFTIFEGSIFIILCFVYYYYVALYVTERLLGGSELIGLLAATMTVGGIIANLMFGKLFSKVKRYTGVISVLICSISIVLLGFGIPLWAVFIMTAINGGVCGIISSFYPIAVNQYVPASKTTYYQSIFTCFMYLAFFTTAYIPNLYMSIFGGGYQKTMLINGMVLGVTGLTILLIIKIFIVKQDTKMTKSNVGITEFESNMD